MIEDEDKSLLKDGLSGQLEEVLLNGFRKARQMKEGRAVEKHSFFSNLTTSFTLVGIGAPAHVYLNDVAQAMGTKCVIPENAHVANAIGAITGNIRTEKKVSVTPNYSPSGITGYNVFSISGKSEFKNYDKAVESAEKQAYEDAYESAVSKGAVSIDVSLSTYKNDAKASLGFDDADNPDDDNKNKVLIETIITAIAVGKPIWNI